jgi:hypothetical protein
MSYTSNIGGKLTVKAKGDIKSYAKENIEINSAKTIKITGDKNGISTNKPEDSPVLKLENGVDIFAEFKPIATFEGEFGFDWLEWDEKDAITKIQDIDISNFEYLFNNSKNEYVAISTDISLKNKIKEEYKKHQINYPYYIPWLNISPNQGEIKLNMYTKSIIANNDISKEVITFEKNDSYQITIDGLVNENIKYSPNGQPKEVSIKCIKPSIENEIIAKNEKGKIIGKIRVKDNTNTYVLPIRLVFVVKDSPVKDTEINQLITDFKSEGIEDYLNKNSLNQALIKTTIEIDAKHHLAFDENDWSGKFYDKTNHWLTNRKDSAGGKVTYTDDDGQEIKNAEYEHILDKFLTDYKSNFETDGKKFKGILLFVTNINKDPSDKEGGVSRTQPLNFREAIVFKSNLKNKSTYSHEIAHALGLEHIFWRDTEYKIELEKTKESLKKNEETLASNKQIMIKNNEALKGNQNNIKTRETEINKWKGEIAKPTYPYKKEAKDRIKYLEDQNKETEDINKKIKENIKKGNKDNSDIEAYINKAKNNLLVFKNNKIKFKEKSTKNIMDYSSSTNIYSVWQWSIMQNDVKNYYGSVTQN